MLVIDMGDDISGVRAVGQTRLNYYLHFARGTIVCKSTSAMV